MNKTFFEKWQDREHGYTNLGSFQTRLFEAYQVADSDNRQRLENAFSYWFRTKIEPDNKNCETRPSSVFIQMSGRGSR